jgi:hypothetical protein
MSVAPPAPRSPLALRSGREEPIAHFIVALAIAAYAWILHGLTGAILSFSLIFMASAVTRLAVQAAGGGPGIVRTSRWGWLAAVLAALVVIGRPAAERDCAVRTSPSWSLPQLAFCDDEKESIRRAAHAPRKAPHEHLP